MRVSLASLLVILLPIIASVSADNNYPIILVHGIIGWGRTEMFGFKYWGAFKGDLQEQLKAQGHNVHTAAVGPFSSDWDRACELFAQIKGGRVDYGEVHSKTHGHSRYGRTYPGLYPQWGEIGADGRVNKIHLVGHSMGGQTIRMLAQLLAKGSVGSPTPEVSVTSTASLFAGGKDWVHSITTVSTPNQGTLMSDALMDYSKAIKNMIIGLFGVLDIGGSKMQNIYDVKMDHWGVWPKQPDETLNQYVTRIFDSELLRVGIKDICLWDLSTDGAKQQAAWVETLPNIYYYGVSNSDTKPSKNLKREPIHLPHVTSMLIFLQPFSRKLGGRYGPNHGYGLDWQPNDGLVNTVSMKRDLVGRATMFDGTSVMGQWNVYPTITHMDHLAMTGFSLAHVKEFYCAHANLLKSLPPTQSLLSMTATGASSIQVAAAPVPIASALFGAIAKLNKTASASQSMADLKALCATQATDQMSMNYCRSMLSQTPNQRRSLRGF